MQRQTYLDFLRRRIKVITKASIADNSERIRAHQNTCIPSTSGIVDVFSAPEIAGMDDGAWKVPFSLRSRIPGVIMGPKYVHPQARQIATRITGIIGLAASHNVLLVPSNQLRSDLMVFSLFSTVRIIDVETKE